MCIRDRAYTEEAITERIKGLFVERKPKENRKISLRIDLENSIKVQQFAGYEKWAKLHNLKQAARTLNFLTEHEIESYPDLESRVAEITAASTEAAAALKAAERRLAEMAVLIKDCLLYTSYSTMLLTFSAQISFFSFPYFCTMRKESHKPGIKRRSAINRIIPAGT